MALLASPQLGSPGHLGRDGRVLGCSEISGAEPRPPRSPRGAVAPPAELLELELPRFNTQVPSRDALLAERAHVVALLGAGDASLFDSRTLHCWGANELEDGSTRALFYCSFRNPRAGMPIGNVGSIHPSIKPVTLRELRAKLATLSDDVAFDPFDSSEEEEEALTRYRVAAEEGQSAAQFNLAMCYRRGEGVEKDAAQAVRWFRRAAEQGLALGQTQVGFSFYLGEGVQKDEAEAARWFRLAADQGEVNAQHNLGICLAQGVGVAQDRQRAAELLERAAKQGHEGAAAARQQLAQEMVDIGMEEKNDDTKKS